jgi:hypothetical protein
MNLRRRPVAVYLACPGRAALFRIGSGRERRDGTVTAIARPRGVSRTNYLAALDHFLAGGPEPLTLLIDPDVADLPYVGPGGIAYADHVAAPRPTSITYYGLLWPGYSRRRPGGLIRRQTFDDQPLGVDAVFSSNRRWEPDDHLELYRLGHQDIDHIEVTGSVALAFVLRTLAGLPGADPPRQTSIVTGPHLTGARRAPWRLSVIQVVYGGSLRSRAHDALVDRAVTSMIDGTFFDRPAATYFDDLTAALRSDEPLALHDWQDEDAVRDLLARIVAELDRRRPWGEHPSGSSTPSGGRTCGTHPPAGSRVPPARTPTNLEGIMLVWSGWGILAVPLFALGGLGGTSLGEALGLQLGNNAGTAVGLLVAAVATWVLGRRLSRPRTG